MGEEKMNRRTENIILVLIYAIGGALGGLFFGAMTSYYGARWWVSVAVGAASAIFFISLTINYRMKQLEALK